MCNNLEFLHAYEAMDSVPTGLVLHPSCFVLKPLATGARVMTCAPNGRVDFSGASKTRRLSKLQKCNLCASGSKHINFKCLMQVVPVTA